MINKISIVVLLVLFNLSGISHPLQKGPYTVFKIAKNIYRIENSNDEHPAGIITGKDGQILSVNSCSDIYMILGKEKALLIDLSRTIDWDTTAIESLRSVVYEKIGEKQLFITFTHNHGDHIGMLPAFVNDLKARFLVPEAEFEGMDIFPKNRTVYFEQNESIDLGGNVIINTLEVAGHTKHSTVFFLKNNNLLFSGDAIGSGRGVWLFDKESFPVYKNSINSLINYIENPANEINKEKLVIYGGHFWQGEKIGKLTAQYIYDMQTLIGKIKNGTADAEEAKTFIPFLDANFKYGMATITWNKEAAREYANSSK